MPVAWRQKYNCPGAGTIDRSRAEALGQLRAAIEEAIRTDARQRQTAATEAGTTADVGEQAGDASADLPESESPGNQESESPGNQERWT